MGRAFEVRKAAMAKTGAAKSKLYTKFSKEIYMLAKNGTDPEANLALKHMIEKAKKNQVPADVIKRAIEKASGGNGEDYQSARYEGFGPNGSSIIVDCLTDNVNRTVSEVKNCFTKTNNKIGAPGSVSHVYDSLGLAQVEIPEGFDADEFMIDMIDKDLEILKVEDYGDDDFKKVIYVVDKDLQKLITALENIDIKVLDHEISMVAQMDVTLEGEDKESFEKLLDMLEEVDDVQNIYHNVENV